MEVIEKVWPEWKVERLIGKGSYGSVYKCVRNKDGAQEYSAVKVISVPTNPYEIKEDSFDKMSHEETQVYYKEIADDLVKETDILKTLKGAKNIVEIYDAQVVEKENGVGWYILIRMELLTDFNTYSANKKYTREDVLKLGTDLCNALSVCHEAKIVHRDIKPENIFVDAEGNFKLGDFGVAKQMEKTQGSMSMKGTYNYMSPEVFSGKKCDGKADLYSLALVMYKLLNNNRLPFVDTHKEIVRYSERQEAFERRIRGDQIPAISGADNELNKVILKACAYKSDDRYRNVNEFSFQLQCLAKGEKIKESVSKSSVKKMVFVIAALVAVISVAVVGCYYAFVFSEPAEERIIEFSEPEYINTLYYDGKLNKSIEGKSIYSNEEGIFLEDELKDKPICVTTEAAGNAMFDGKTVCYNIQKPSRYPSYSDEELYERTWCFYDVDTGKVREITEIEFYSHGDADVIYFDKSNLIYLLHRNDGLADMMYMDLNSARVSPEVSSIDKYTVKLDKYIIYSVDKKQNSDYGTIRIYNIESGNDRLVSDRGLLRENSYFYKDGYFYFLEDDSSYGVSVMRFQCSSKKEKTETLAKITDVDFNVQDSRVTLNDNYALFEDAENNESYLLYVYKDKKLLNVKVPDKYGELDLSFVEERISDKILMRFADDDTYSYYEIKENGKLKYIGKQEKV